MASGALRPARVKSFEPVIREIVDDIIDGFIDEGTVEFVEQFSHALPVRLTPKLMGVPDEDTAAIREWAKLEAAGLRFLSREFNETQQARSTAMYEYLRERILERYESRTDDVISDVIEAHVANRGRLDVDEVLPQLRAIEPVDVVDSFGEDDVALRRLEHYLRLPIRDAALGRSAQVGDALVDTVAERGSGMPGDVLGEMAPIRGDDLVVRGVHVGQESLDDGCRWRRHRSGSSDRFGTLRISAASRARTDGRSAPA
jgi:hypothetical protein